MAQLPHSLTDFTLFIDGVGQAGKVIEGTPPKFNEVVDKHSAGGMGGTVPIPLGALEEMECSMSLKGVEADYFKHLGRTVGVTLRGSTNNGEVIGHVIYQMRGRIRNPEQDTFKKDDRGMVKSIITAEYCKLTINSQVIVEADVMGKRFIVDGVDLWAEQRAALGL